MVHNCFHAITKQHIDECALQYPRRDIFDKRIGSRAASERLHETQNLQPGLWKCESTYNPCLLDVYRIWKHFNIPNNRRGLRR